MVQSNSSWLTEAAGLADWQTGRLVSNPKRKNNNNKNEKNQTKIIGISATCVSGVLYEGHTRCMFALVALSRHHTPPPTRGGGRKWEGRKGRGRKEWGGVGRFGEEWEGWGGREMRAKRASKSSGRGTVN
jgi:hypothetical protein